MSAPAPFRLPDAPVETDLIAKYFRGLSDPIRLRILELLRAEGELTVGQRKKFEDIMRPNDERSKREEHTPRSTPTSADKPQ